MARFIIITKNKMFKKVAIVLVFAFTTVLFAWNPPSKAEDWSIEYPYLSFARSSRIEHKGIFDLNYSSIRDSRILNNGDEIRTKKAIWVELFLTTESVLRLDDNTEFEVMNYGTNDFTVVLKKWQCWANVKNINLEIKAGNTIVSLKNGSANVVREDNKTIVTSIKNSTKVALFDDNNKYLNHLYAPAQNKITAVDSAITLAYSQIKLAKLKKEVKMTHLDEDDYTETEWFKKNLSDDLTFVARVGSDFDQEYTKVRISQAASTLKNSLNFLTFNVAKTQESHLERIHDLYKNAFYFASLNETERAKLNLEKISQIELELNEENLQVNFDNLLDLYQNYREVSFTNSEFFVKKELQENILLLAKEETKIYEEQFQMDEIANFEKHLFAYSLSEAKTILVWIIESWENKNSFSEFEKEIFFVQTEGVYNAFLSNIENIDEDLLASQIKLEKIKLAVLDEAEKKESALEILTSRIRLSSAFLDLRKYKLAKYVAEENIEELTQNLDQTSQSIQNYLSLLKKEVDTKIAYIEENLHGSAHYNEDNYKDYFSKTEEEEEAYQTLVEYEKNQAKLHANNETQSNIEINVVLEKFRLNNVYVLSGNIERLENLSDKFRINEARTADWDLFSAKFNASTNALYEIVFSKQKINNSLLLSEINEALKYIPVVVDSQYIEIDTIENKSNDSLTFELKRETALKILKNIGLEVEKENLVKDSDGNLITTLVILETSITFILDEVKQTASGIVVDGFGEITDEVNLSNLNSEVEAYITEQEKEREMNSVKSNLEENNFMFDVNKMQKIGEKQYRIENIYDQKNWVLFNGIYTLEGDIFIEADLSDLWILNNIKTSSLINEITKLKVAKEQAELEAEIAQLAEQSTFSGEE